jgi:hypothetical protein
MAVKKAVPRFVSEVRAQIHSPRVLWAFSLELAACCQERRNARILLTLSKISESRGLRILWEHCYLGDAGEAGGVPLIASSVFAVTP